MTALDEQKAILRDLDDQFGKAIVVVRPDAVLIAGIRLHEAMYHADIEWLKALPLPVQEAFGDLQDAIFRATRRSI